MEIIKLPLNIYHRIMDTIGTVPEEAGGIFMLQEGSRTVSYYYYDAAAGTGKPFYKPSEDIDRVINQRLALGERFGGFLHSHHSGCSAELSPMDCMCAELNLRSNHLPWIYMGVVYEANLYLYKLTAGSGEPRERLEACTFEIPDDDTEPLYRRRIPPWFEALVKEKIAAQEGD